MRRVLVAAAVLLLAAVPPAFARARYDVRTLAKVPPPGQPALALVAPDRTIYEGTFTNSAGAANGPSKVFAYSPSGRLLRTYVIQGQDPSANNGVQVAAYDAAGRLYLLDQHPARVIVLDPRTGAQTNYATFKDVPGCAPPGVGNECSATLADNPAEPDYAAWGTDGSLYVTDYTQGLIWKVPPGGGQAHVWFTDPRLDGAQFGPAGILLKPDRRTLLFSTSAGGASDPSSATTGELYTLGIKDNGNPGALSTLWESGPAEAPDGIALARSGNVYMGLVGPNVNALVVIAPNGREIARIRHDSGDPPFDEPASAWFDGTRLIVANDAYISGDASHFALFDVFAGEPGEPIFVPGLSPSQQPARAKKRARYRLRVRPRRVHAGRRVTVRVRVTRNGKAVRRARVKLGRAHARTGKRGRARLHVRLHRGRHAVRLITGKRRTLVKKYIRAR
jgi:sugar lactone lactonase YvrE